MTAPVLRPFAAADLVATVAMQSRAVEVLGRSHYTADEIALLVAASREPGYAAELLANDLWLAVDGGGTILGSAGWGRAAGADGGVRGRIRKVFVEPGIAGRGLGRTLVEAAEARARAAGLRDFVVRANLNAVPFYERLGYRTTGPGGMLVAGREVAMTMMEKPAETAG